MEVQVRKPFRFLPSVVWALSIDAIDIVALPITTILSNIPVLGQLVSSSFTLFQGLLAGIVFEDPKMVLGILEGGLDLVKGIPLIGMLATVGDTLIPSYTIMYFLISWRKI